MIDRDAFDRYDRALSTNADLVAAAVASLEKEMDGLAFDEMVAALESRYRALVTEYGTYAAAVAVEFYAQQREASRPETDYEAVQCYPKDWTLLADDVRTEAVRGREVAEVLRSLAGRSQQRVMAYADETIDRNAALDPARPKWAIVPHVGACAWCVTLGSFGFAYGSKSVAINARHPWCKCTPAPDFDRDKPYLSGYNPEEMYDAYRMCQDTVRDDAERRWAAMSEEERSRYTSAGHVHKDGTRGPRRVDYQAYLKRRTVKEMGRRDRRWLQGWDGLKPTFENEQLEEDIRKNRPQEMRTATRVCAHGVPADFQVDKEDWTDPRTGLNQPRGKADLANGYELKTLEDASTFSTIDGYLAQTSKKKSDAVAVVFDNTENDAMTDADLEGYILKSRRFRRGRVYLLSESGYRQIR